MGETRPSRAFSLIELVIVIVILAVVAAIAIPRMMRGAQNAGAVALKGDLAVLRNAIELYCAEHEGRYPDDATTLADQLTMYTKSDGTDPDSAFDVASGRVYGPYIRAIPPLPVGPKAGATGVQAAPPAGPDIGWIYVGSAGTIRAATKPELVDSDGVPYRDY